MEAEKFAKQVIDFQKATFDNTFTAAVMMQDQAERMFNSLMEQANWLPDEGRRTIDEWVGAYKKGRADLKGVIDENFTKLAEMWEADPTPKKPQVSPMTKMK